MCKMKTMHPLTPPLDGTLKLAYGVVYGREIHRGGEERVAVPRDSHALSLGAQFIDNTGNN
jgi:hypothetical protein